MVYVTVCGSPTHRTEWIVPYEILTDSRPTGRSGHAPQLLILGKPCKVGCPIDVYKDDYDPDDCECYCHYLFKLLNLLRHTQAQYNLVQGLAAVSTSCLLRLERTAERTPGLAEGLCSGVPER